eukprot:12918094-Prorocentrum_lima.AAC.1
MHVTPVQTQRKGCSSPDVCAPKAPHATVAVQGPYRASHWTHARPQQSNGHLPQSTRLAYATPAYHRHTRS